MPENQPPDQQACPTMTSDPLHNMLSHWIVQIVQSFSPFIPLHDNSHAQIPKLPHLIGIYWECVLVNPRLTPCCPPLPTTCLQNAWKIEFPNHNVCDFVRPSLSLSVSLVCHVLYRFSFAFIAIFIWSEYHLWQLKVFSANLFSILFVWAPNKPKSSSVCWSVISTPGPFMS